MLADLSWTVVYSWSATGSTAPSTGPASMTSRFSYCIQVTEFRIRVFPGMRSGIYQDPPVIIFAFNVLPKFTIRAGSGQSQSEAANKA